jgi:hypothetical protein
MNNERSLFAGFNGTFTGTSYVLTSTCYTFSSTNGRFTGTKCVKPVPVYTKPVTGRTLVLSCIILTKAGKTYIASSYKQTGTSLLKTGACYK